MKKIKHVICIFGVLFCNSVMLHAQFAGSIEVKNDLKCEVHYTIRGGTGPCGVIESTTFTIPPLTTMVHSAALLGFSGISGAKQYPVVGCTSPTPPGVPFGPCPGSGLSILLYTVSLSCVRCTDHWQFYGHYTVEPGPGAMAKLRFVP